MPIKMREEAKDEWPHRHYVITSLHHYIITSLHHYIITSLHHYISSVFDGMWLSGRGGAHTDPLMIWLIVMGSKESSSCERVTFLRKWNVSCVTAPLFCARFMFSSTFSLIIWSAAAAIRYQGRSMGSIRERTVCDTSLFLFVCFFFLPWWWECKN